MLIDHSFKEFTNYKDHYKILNTKYNEGYVDTVYRSTQCIRPIKWINIMKNKELIRWLSWVNKNICMTICVDDYVTTGVKLRIATGMLNKIESLTDLEKIQIHMNLVSNVNAERYFVETEDLPF